MSIFTNVLSITTNTNPGTKVTLRIEGFISYNKDKQGRVSHGQMGSVYPLPCPSRGCHSSALAPLSRNPAVRLLVVKVVDL